MRAGLRLAPSVLLPALVMVTGWLLRRSVRTHEETADSAVVGSSPAASTGRTAAAPDAAASRFTGFAWATVVVPVVLWAVSLGAVDLEGIGRHGLAAGLPATWYAALAIALAGATRTLLCARFDGVLAAAHVAVIVVIVYATVPAVADMPQYAWTYKHIGVTQSIEQVGSATPMVDIYHRWPGFFALAAVFSRLSGLGDPMSYAAWSEPVFSLLAAVVVAAIARAVSRNSRAAGLAALLFVLSAWVGQSYFAPQPLAYVLALTLMLVVLRQLTDGRRWLPWIARRVAPAEEAPRLGWTQSASAATVVGLCAVVVVTHQLTPYMILLALVALAVLGVLRPRRIVLLAVALPAAYLLLNLSYVRENFPLFNGINPGENWRAGVSESSEPWLVAHAGGLVSAFMWGLALFAVVLLLRRRRGAAPLMVFALAIAPAFTVLGLTYGGEASLRVHYFAAPWLAVLAGWGLVALPRGRRRAGATFLALMTVTTLFLVAFFGRTALNVIAPDEVRASRYFYANARPNSLLVLVNPGFPMRASAAYTTMHTPEGGDTSPNLMGRQNAELVRRGSLSAVATTLRQLGGTNAAVGRYIVFSRSQARYADVNRILSFAESRRLERAVAGSPAFRLWHRTANARIYEAVGP